MDELWNKTKFHVMALAIFIVLSAIYFAPMFEGKGLRQSDMMHWQGMAKEIMDFRENTSEEPLWTNSMFSGMPAYFISLKQPGNFMVYVNALLTSKTMRPAIHAFLYMLGFYILLQFFGINVFLSIAGAIAYGFSSYFFIILVPGHITKAIALGYMPMIIGAVYYTYKKNSIYGAALAGFFTSLQLLTSHFQITYYTFLIILLMVIFEVYRVIKEKEYSKFISSSASLAAGIVIAFGINATGILTVLDYTEYSMRGPAELTTNTEDQTSSGLDKTYVTQWSYGLGETFNLMIPNFKGGASDHLYDSNSNIFKYLNKRYGNQNAVQVFNQNPGLFTHYWGNQPGTSGPVYIGATIIFLFVLGMFLLKNNLKWWLFSATLIAILLAWGKNFMFLTDLFLDYFPGYSKFRTVSMILVIAQFTIPLMAILTIKHILTENIKKTAFKNALMYSLMITAGLSLIFALAPGISNLSSPLDSFLTEQGLQDWVVKLKEDRASLLRGDAFRSFFFILGTALLIYLVWLKKLNHKTFYVLFPLLILVDLWPVNKRYLNKDNFVPKREIKDPFIPYAADLEILKDKDLYYRVYDLTVSPFNSSRSAYFHKSVGGYHGAKMRRYQDLYDHHLSKGNEKIFDMLNTKYLIIRAPEGGAPEAVVRENSLGNAWFVEKYIIVNSPDEEIEALNDFDPAKEMIVDKKFRDMTEDFTFVPDSQAYITLTSYAPNHITYDYSASHPRLTIFSDIYYHKGWELYINGTPAPYFRANYVLRAAVLPAGNYQIDFVFKPSAYFTGNKIAFASSVVLLIFLLSPIFKLLSKKSFYGVNS